MSPLGKEYTFENFLERLERSSVAHMSPLYHEHRELFVHRPDMFARAILSLSWERGLALVKAAYYAQPVAIDVYRALLARMLQHNQHVMRTGAGHSVDWRAALLVHDEVMRTYGAATPTRLTLSTLRLLAPSRRWKVALSLLQMRQSHGQLTKSMLVDAARVCAVGPAWAHALRLLMHVHTQQPSLLCHAIQSLRPPGTTAFTAAQAMYSLLPSSTAGTNNTDDARNTSKSGVTSCHASASTCSMDSPHAVSSTALTAKHIVRVLNDVVAAVPSRVALQHPLCHSYLTHLVASTTLSVERKTKLLTQAMQSLSCRQVMALLENYTEPTLPSLGEMAHTSTDAGSSDHHTSQSRRRDGCRKTNDSGFCQSEGTSSCESACAEERKLLKRAKKTAKRRRKSRHARDRKPTATCLPRLHMSVESSNSSSSSSTMTESSDSHVDAQASRSTQGDELASSERELSTTVDNDEDDGSAAAEAVVGAQVTERDKAWDERAVVNAVCNDASSPHVSSCVNQISPRHADVVAVFDALQQRMRWLESSPGTVAAMVAVMVAKMPSALTAWAFVRHCARAFGTAVTDASHHGCAVHACSVTPSQFSSLSSSSSPSSSCLSAVTRHPAVIHALLRRCVDDSKCNNDSDDNDDGADRHDGKDDCYAQCTEKSRVCFTPTCGDADSWGVAATVLLTQSGGHVRTPAEVLSHVVMQLRQARRVSLAVRVLQEHMVPTQSQISGAAMEAMLECVLAHNRSVHVVEQRERSMTHQPRCASSLASSLSSSCSHSSYSTSPSTSTLVSSSHTGLVHWKSALSWAVDLRAAEAPRGIVRTGTGSEDAVGVIRGAPARHPRSQLLPSVTPLSARALNLLVRICVDGGSPLGALRALGYAREVNKLELAMHAELRALLYCDLYHRPAEARAIVEHARTRHGAQAAQPLQEILALMCSVKRRQARNGKGCEWRMSDVVVAEACSKAT